MLTGLVIIGAAVLAAKLWLLIRWMRGHGPDLPPPDELRNHSGF